MGIEADVPEEELEAADRPTRRRLRPRHGWAPFLGYTVLPVFGLVFATAAGYFKWWAVSGAHPQSVAESVQAAKDGTVALLSYRPDTVDTDLGAARVRLTGTFLDSYSTLTHDVVIPGAKQRKIAAVATVPAAASLSVDNNHAVVLVFVDQSTTVGSDAPTQTASTVKVTLTKVASQWLISGFDPI